MKSFLILAGLVALLVLAGPASASVIIDFEQGTVTGGTITDLGGGNASGTNIPVDLMKVSFNSGATFSFYDLFGAGASGADDTNANGSALLNFNTSTGLFTIVGGVCTTLSTTNCPGTDTLVAGGTTLVNGTGAAGSINFSSTTLVFRQRDTKSPALLEALGIPTAFGFALMSATFNYTGASSPFTVGSLDVQNVGTVIPEPTSVLLLGTVLLGVTQLIRRRAPKV